MSLGFTKAGFKVVAAFDNWKPAVETYRANLGDHAFIADLGTEEAAVTISTLNPDIVVGGPPCQDFSSAGPNKHTSNRAGLVRKFVDVIESSSPTIFVMENVPRLSVRPIFAEAIGRFRSLGYGLTTRVLDASYCGVPQARKRLFVIGHLGGKDGFLEPYLNAKLAKHPLTLRKYFGSELDTDFYFRVPTNYGRRGVFSVDEPSVTIRAVDRPIPSGYPGHPEDSAPIGPKVRALTVSERQRIQTFPTSFKFVGTKSTINQLIGNAVPVNLAEFVATAIWAYLSDQQK